jgi:class 3 adenylate cyclase/predicted ATPase
MVTCTSCGHEAAAPFKFCPECGAPAAGSRELRKTVTVLFCDVTGSTALGERLDPEPLRALLARYFERMRTIVERHGGTVEKFVGDAVMAVFGVPSLHEDDALRAVRAAVEMRDALPELGVAARIGLNSGEVVVGTGERLATGDAVNLAARLEQVAAPGEILLGENTLRLVRDAVEAAPTEPLELKGKTERIVAYRLLAVREHAPPFVRRLDAPLVGRDRELRRLQETFAQAVDDSSCQLFTLLGVAGIGKSRLTSEFVGSLVGGTIVRGRCLPYGEGITYWPVVEVMKQLPAATELGLDRAAVRAIGQMLGEEEAVSSSEEIAWAVRKLLEAAAASSPLVAVFDDIHWGEPTFLELLEHVADLSRQAPLMLLCLARPELLDRRPGWGGGKLNATTVLLEPLSSAETEELLERLLGDAALSNELRAQIRDAAEGNPLFVEEMLALADESGDAEVQVPPTIQAVLAARLDQLEPAERGVLECGAVEGRVFHRGAVQALAPGETQVQSRLIGLVRKELVRPEKPQLPGEDAYRFRHLLIRDAAYGALSKASRAKLHERFATWLQEHGAALVEFDELVGFHLESAVRYRRELDPSAADDDVAGRAASHLASAGRKALAYGDSRAAVTLLGRAVALADPVSDACSELLLDLALALAGAGDLAAGMARAAEAAELARSHGDRALELRARCERALIRATTDPGFTGEAQIAEGNEAVQALKELDDDAGLAVAWRLIAAGENLLAHWDGMAAALTKALPYARRAGDRRRERDLLRELALSTYWGPMPVSTALPRCNEMLAQAGESGLLRAILLMCVAGLRSMEGRYDDARSLLAEAQSICEGLGRSLELTALGFFRGPLELAAGDLAAAEAALRASCDALQKMGETGWYSSLAAYLAQALYAQDRLPEAEEQAQRSREAAAPDDQSAQAAWRAVYGKILARRGRIDEAEGLVREAVAIADRTDQLIDRGDAYCDLAEVLILGGRNKEAAVALEAAAALFAQKGNLPFHERARARLAQLGAEAPTSG